MYISYEHGIKKHAVKNWITFSVNIFRSMCVIFMQNILYMSMSLNFLIFSLMVKVIAKYDVYLIVKYWLLIFDKLCA